MKFHIILEANNPPEKIAELALLAESYGISGIWTSNMHDSRDPFVNFVDAARATSKIKLGPVAVSPYELHPLKMANALLTLNEISGGRAHIGVGAGDGGTATAMGIKAVRRVTAARECVEIIEAAATGEPVGDVMGGGLALHRGGGGKDHLMDQWVAGARHQTGYVEVVGPAPVQRRKGSTEHVVAAAKGAGALQRP